MTEQRRPKFDYHLGLHHTQTLRANIYALFVFDYHLGLHHTQTKWFELGYIDSFDYHLGLHHTQTSTISFFLRF